jgi:nucleoside phosphorylase
MTKRFFELLLIVPLEEELLEVQRVFPQREELSSETLYRYDAVVGDSGLRMLVVQQQEMGRNAARDAVEASFEEFNFGLVICLGIAGSLSEDLRLCDVCYSEHVYDLYDNTRANDAKNGDLEMRFSPNHVRCHPPLIAAINFIRTVPELQDLYAAWQLERESVANRLIPSEVIGRKGGKEVVGQPRSKQCKVACAAVSKSENYNAAIRSIDRKISAIETEIGGVIAALNRRGIPAITIRGISDYADSAKGQLEGTTGGIIRSLAAGNAASFLRLQFNNPRFVDAARKLADTHANGIQPVFSIVAPAGGGINGLIEKCSVEIERRLRDVAPSFKLQEKGYRLPVPRIRKMGDVSDIGSRFAAVPLEVRDALERHPIILLGMNKNYPDASVPWVIASDLLTAEIDGKQMIPIVVQGEVVRPPRTGLSEGAYWSFDDTADIPGAQIVYVLDSAALSSKTRTDFLVEEIKRREHCRFVIVTREETQLLLDGDFSAQTKAAHYHLTNVSFYEIALFVEKNFEMTPPEAELIAMRLNETFNNYKLSAHPTYFAGLSKSLLGTLLQANRRSELIQLAVDGFMLLVVAADKAKVKLSRTTRTRFLRNLVTELKVEKRTLTMASAVALASEFANLHGYDIDARDFVASFLDCSILHVVGDRLQFSLPFVESYLLALELSTSPEKALRYFDLEDEVIDLGTFDLYCELNPSPGIINLVVAAVERLCDSLTIPEGRKHILLTDAARPALTSNAEQLRPLAERWEKLSDDVKAGRGDVGHKQKIIDMAERFKETASSRFDAGDAHEDLSTDKDMLAVVYRNWRVGTQMLGSAAEHLTASTKEQLASALIRTASLLTHAVTDGWSQIDFGALRGEFTSDEVIGSILNGDKDAAKRERTRREMKEVVDLFEFVLMASPLHTTLSVLCETARLNVLAASVEKAKTEGEVDNLIHALWLADIDGSRGHGRLVKEMKALPYSPLLRIIVGSHLMERVYWNHANKQDRQRFLDAAEIALRPIISIRKGQIMRRIASSEVVDGDRLATERST